MAWAAAKFTQSLLCGLNGEQGVIELVFVKRALFEKEDLELFSSKLSSGWLLSARLRFS
jgi:malate dehydrogenase